MKAYQPLFRTASKSCPDASVEIVLTCSVSNYRGAISSCSNSERLSLRAELKFEYLPYGLLFLLSPIFLCHKIKDGGYNSTVQAVLTHPKYTCTAVQGLHGHIPCMLAGTTQACQECGLIWKKPCCTVNKVPLTENSLLFTHNSRQ